MQIAGFIQRCIMGVDELLDFAFRDHIGGVGQNLQHAHAAHFHHHLERAGVQKVSDQNAGRVAEGLVGRSPATAQCGLIHHIVVQQGCRVDQFHHGGQNVFVLALVAECAGDQQQQCRTQAFAACGNDVLGDLCDQGTLVVSR